MNFLVEFFNFERRKKTFRREFWVEGMNELFNFFLPQIDSEWKINNLKNVFQIPNFSLSIQLNFREKNIRLEQLKAFFPHFAPLLMYWSFLALKFNRKRRNPSNSHMLKRVWHFAIEFIGFRNYFPLCDLSCSSFAWKSEIFVRKRKKCLIQKNLNRMKKVSVVLWWDWVHPNHSLASSCVILLHFLSQVSKTCMRGKMRMAKNLPKNPPKIQLFIVGIFGKVKGHVVVRRRQFVPTWLLIALMVDEVKQMNENYVQSWKLALFLNF